VRTLLLRILALPLKAVKERVSSRKYSIMLQNFFRFRPPPLSKSKPEGSNYRLFEPIVLYGINNSLK
jgi:hypothetical protein